MLEEKQAGNASQKSSNGFQLNAYMLRDMFELLCANEALADWEE